MTASAPVQEPHLLSTLALQQQYLSSKDERCLTSGIFGMQHLAGRGGLPEPDDLGGIPGSTQHAMVAQMKAGAHTGSTDTEHGTVTAAPAAGHSSDGSQAHSEQTFTPASPGGQALLKSVL